MDAGQLNKIARFSITLLPLYLIAHDRQKKGLGIELTQPCSNELKKKKRKKKGTILQIYYEEYKKDCNILFSAYIWSKTTYSIVQANKNKDI